MNKKLFFLYIFVVLLLFGVGLYLINKEKPRIPVVSFISPTITPFPTLSIASDSAEMAVVKRVVDGDTIELSDGRKVRYIGVDTPELKGQKCFAQEATEKNRELVEGKTIQMKKDVSETDRYKRLLRYVYVDSLFVNEYLAREGFALQATFPPDVKYVELFGKAVEEARVKNKGLWNACK